MTDTQIHELLNDMTKADLLRWFWLFEPVLAPRPEMPPALRQRVEQPKYKHTKAGLIDLYSYAVSKPERYARMREAMTDPLGRMFDLLLLRRRWSIGDLEVELGTRLGIVGENHYLLPKRYEHLGRQINTYYGFRSANTQHITLRHKEDFVFELPNVIRAICLPHTRIPKSYLPLEMDAPDKDWTVYNAEVEFLGVYPRMRGAIEQKLLKTTAKSRISRTGLNKLAKLVGATPFFNGKPEKRFQHLHTYLLALGSFRWKNYHQDSPEEMLRTAIETEVLKTRPGYPFVAPVLLFHLKELAKQKDDYFDSYDERNALRYVATLKPNRWYNIDSLIRHFLAITVDFSPIVYRRTFYQSDPEADYGSRKYRSDSYKYVLAPCLRGIYALLGSMGLVDLAYEAPPAAPGAMDDPYCSFRAVRLNALGAYAFGLTDHYESAATIDTSYSLDPQFLLLRSTGDDQTATLLLDEFTRKLGPNRYQLDHAQFLKGLTTRADFLKKFERFVQIVKAEELPANWQDWRDHTASRFDALTPLDHYRVFQLDPGNRELQQLLVRDATLAKLVRRVEGYGVLVAQKDFRRFTNRMRELGYVV